MKELNKLHNADALHFDEWKALRLIGLANGLVDAVRELQADMGKIKADMPGIFEAVQKEKPRTPVAELQNQMRSLREWIDAQQ